MKDMSTEELKALGWDIMMAIASLQAKLKAVREELDGRQARQEDLGKPSRDSET